MKKKQTAGERFADKYIPNAPAVSREEMAKQYDHAIRRAQATAWDEGYDHAADERGERTHSPNDNPYRKAKR